MAKSATMKELIVSLLGTFVRKYNHALSEYQVAAVYNGVGHC